MSEPSAFELQSGATKKELKNLQLSNKNLEAIITDFQNRLSSLEEFQAGVKSLYEGQTLKLKNLTDTSVSLQNSINSIQSLLQAHSEALKNQSDLNDALKGDIQANKKAIKELDDKLNSMSDLLSKMNTSMIEQLNALKNSLQAPVSEPVKLKVSDKKIDKEQDFDKSIKDPKSIFNEALDMYKKKQFDGSKVRLEWLLGQKYRPAHILYLLGEIAYKEKKYPQAITYYKKSALENDKASYMPILLWHTAWAFRYSKDLANYNKFLDSLIYLYPNSEQGQKARDIREKTKKDKK